MLRLFQAFSDQDGARMAAATLAFSGEEQTCPDKDGFIQDVDTRFNNIQAAQQRGEIRDGAEALGSLLELVRQHQAGFRSKLHMQGSEKSQETKSIQMFFQCNLATNLRHQLQLCFKCADLCA